ncbi:MAG: fatty acid desaturase [Hydrogenophilales bacterium]|nr:fatty acid desaturase [Hydrogenophilales bacterium]
MPSSTAKQVRQALSIYARPHTRRGLTLYLLDVVQYLLALAAVLWLPWLAGKLIASVLVGIKMANLVTLAHDAAHNSLTRSRALNKFIAITSLTPALFNYRLWVYDHHYLHHPDTNELHPDSYTPYSKDTFDALPRWRRALERAYRAPTLWTFGLYYIVERWSRAKFIPRRHMPDAVRRDAWPHFFYLTGYWLAYVAALAAAPLYSNTGSLTALVLGFVVPFYVFQSLFAFTVYVQHTHPRVAWFAEVPDRNGDARQDFISVHLRFPRLLSVLMHHVFDHAAHHVIRQSPVTTCLRRRPGSTS